MRKFLERCPDCGVIKPPHVKGCMTKAVEDGELTPRARQVKIVERRMLLGIETREIDGMGSLIDGVRRATAGAKDDSVIYMNPEDAAGLSTESGITLRGWPINFQGFPVKVDDMVPEGTLVVVPERVDKLVSAAPDSMNVKVGVDVGGGPAMTMTFLDEADDLSPQPGSPQHGPWRKSTPARWLT